MSMGQWLDQLLQLSISVRDFVWGNWMVGLLVLTGIILTLVTGVIQIRKLFPAFKLVLLGARGKDYEEEEEGDISPFAALMTALAATVGNMAQSNSMALAFKSQFGVPPVISGLLLSLLAV